MDSEVSRLTGLLEKFDKNLFAKRDGLGFVRVYCHSFEWKPYEFDGITLLAPVDKPYHVFSLTKNWSYWGERVQWGYLPLYEKLRAVSLEQRDRVFKEIEDSEKRAEEAKERNLKSLSETMAKEMRDVIKIETGDILTHSMDRKKDKRRLNDKRIKGI